MRILKLDSTDSTNNWLAAHEKLLSSPSLVYCVSQTAGRGQRGNSWESEPGKNITASILFHPQDFPASKQFLILEAVALAIVDFLRSKGVEAKVKWPNDIYVGDKKICGTLVEHVVSGKNITRTIAGFGINMNQEKFISKAPNPVSLCMLTGKQYDIDQSIQELAGFITDYLSQLNNRDKLHKGFTELLWRFDGCEYEFYDHKEKKSIRGKLNSVGTDGILSIITQNGENRDYAFKEIEFII